MGRRPTSHLGALALAAGGGLAIASAGAPLDLAALGFAGPALLLGAIELSDASPGRAFLLGALCATVTNGVALHWIVGLLETFAGFPTIASVPTALLLWVAQSLAFAFAAAGAAAARRAGAPLWLALPAFIVVACSVTPTLFPWRLAGTQASVPLLIQVAELGGEPLLDLFVALAGCGAAEAMLRPRRSVIAAALLAVAIPAVYGAVRLPAVRAERREAPLLRVGVVQPNVGIFEKSDPALVFVHLRRLREMTWELEQAGAELVVWPETAYPFRIRRTATAGTARAARARQGTRVPLLVGAITVDGEGNRYNSVVALDPAGEVRGIADKVELLAFGEYVPFWELLPPLQERFPRGLVPGAAPRVLEIAGARVAVLNCYEDVLPRYGVTVARQHPDLLVNATNDAWFGDTSEPWLHQAVARLRAVETRRDLVRAVNTGVSSHTLATGEDVERRGTFVQASFVAQTRLLRGTTPWVRFGDTVSPALAGALLGVALALRRRRA